MDLAITFIASSLPQTALDPNCQNSFSVDVDVLCCGTTILSFLPNQIAKLNAGIKMS